MNIDKLIKELELLADSCNSNYSLEVNGYSQGVYDAIDLVKKLTIPANKNNSIYPLKCDCGETEDIKLIAICPSCYNPHTGEW